MNPSPSLTGHRNAGIYFICNTCSGSVAEDNEITNTFYGALFAVGLKASTPNTLRKNTIHHIKCDSVSLAGFGRVLDNEIYETGWDCENGPIPGGGIYCLESPGGELTGNTLKNQCGMNIDIDSCANLVIKNNTLELPGYDFGGTAPWCVGAPSFGMVDTRNSTIEGNIVTNAGRASNRLGLAGDPNKILKPSVGAAFSDLPSGGNQAVAFLFAYRPGASFAATGNTITGNVFIGNCPSPCVGMGFFASRGTGFDSAGGWSASTTNYFTKNNVAGSQIGSKRCGANWYAANATCNGGGADAVSCNNDDHQHNPPTGDWARNDHCGKY